MATWKQSFTPPISLAWLAVQSPPGASLAELKPRLEPQGSSKDNSPAGRYRKVNCARNVIADRGITEPIERRLGSCACIFHERINACIVRVVKHVYKRGPEFEGRAFIESKYLADGKVGYVADLILHDVPWRIAKGRTEDRLSGTSVNDETHLIVCNGKRCASWARLVNC